MTCYDYANSLELIDEDLYEVTAFDPDLFFCYDTFEREVRRLLHLYDDFQVVRPIFKGIPISRMYISTEAIWNCRSHKWASLNEAISTDSFHFAISGRGKSIHCNCEGYLVSHIHVDPRAYILSYLIRELLAKDTTRHWISGETWLHNAKDWIDKTRIEIINSMPSIEESLAECNTIESISRVYDNFEIDYYSESTIDAITDRGQLVLSERVGRHGQIFA